MSAQSESDSVHKEAVIETRNRIFSNRLFPLVRGYIAKTPTQDGDICHNFDYFDSEGMSHS